MSTPNKHRDLHKASVGFPISKAEASRLPTSGEINAQWETTLRKTSSGTNSVKKTKGPKKIEISQNMLKSMRTETKQTTDENGRPSIATMTAQWEFMKAQFVQNQDEELKWLMVSKNGGAYKYAHDKYTKAENQYFKSIHDCDVLELKTNLLQPEQYIQKYVSIFAKYYDSLQRNPHDEEARSAVSVNQLAFKEEINMSLKHVFSSDLDSQLKSLAFGDNFVEISRKSRRILETYIPEERKRIATKLHLVKQTLEECLKEMEKWGNREKQTADYDLVIAEEDNTWMNQNTIKNENSLRKMRSLIPVDISSISIVELISRAKQNGHLITLELAQELKSNKLLHWIVTHKDDIAFSNFLAGDMRQYFVNIDCLDVVEMRAICMCIPSRFELDNDGSKAEWRERFIMRLKQLCAQENGDCVSGPWDDGANRRIMVQLPPLKPEQMRRQIYFFRTYSQSQAKLKQYVDKAAILGKKQMWLSNAESKAAELKKEYDITVEESRDASLKSTYGADIINKAKDMAKKEFLDADRNAKQLKKDVQLLISSINSNPVSKEQFMQNIQDIDEYLTSRNIDWKTSEETVEITGTFSDTPEIMRVNRDSAKFVTAEQEAIHRMEEMQRLKRKEIPDAVSIIADSAVNEVTGINVAEINLIESIIESGPIIKNNIEKIKDNEDEMQKLSEVSVGRKRNSILLTANAEMISKLNNIFSGNSSSSIPGCTPNKSTKRSSLIPQTAECSIILSGNDENTDPLQLIPAPSKKTNSKTLQVFFVALIQNVVVMYFVIYSLF